MAGAGLVAAPVENALQFVITGAGIIRRPRPVATAPWQRYVPGHRGAPCVVSGVCAPERHLEKM